MMLPRLCRPLLFAGSSRAILPAPVRAGPLLPAPPVVSHRFAAFPVASIRLPPAFRATRYASTSRSDDSREALREEKRQSWLGSAAGSRVAGYVASSVRSIFCVATWLWFSLRLIIFSTLLLPPFARIGWTYLRDPRIIRGVRFGDCSRRLLDIYVPEGARLAQTGQAPPTPVVIAVMGGAWVLGYRAWNAQLGQRLMDAGVMVVAVDYRNYPFVQVPDMVEDVDRGIAWVFENIAAHGGDPNNVMLTGQSAGAHLSVMALLQRSLAEAERAADPEGHEYPPGSSSWMVEDLQGWVGVSGVYDLAMLAEHLKSRHLGGSLLRHMCPGGDLARWSPRQLLDSEEWKALQARAVARLPPMLLYHGGADKSVPVASSSEFAKALRVAGVTTSLEVTPGIGHAEVIIEGPMRGEDHEVQLLLPYLLGRASDERFQSLPELKPMYPRWIIDLASRIMPF